MAFKRFAVLLGIALLSSVPSAYAQGVQGQGNQGADRNPLARVKTLKCTFTTTATGGWTNNQSQVQVKTEEVVFTLEGIDAQEGTAHVPGAPGDITAVL